MHSHVHRQPLMYLFILRKNTQLYIIGCKTRCLFCNLLIFSIYCGETGKQKRFYAFCNKLYSNKLIRYKNAFLLIFVADMSLDKTSITSENQRILVIQLRLFNNSIYILPSNQPNNAIKKYFSNIHLLRNLLCSGCSGTDYQHFLYHHGYI